MGQEGISKRTENIVSVQATFLGGWGRKQQESLSCNFRPTVLKVTFLGGVEPEVKYWFAAMGANVTIWRLLFFLNTPENMHTFSPG